MFHELSELLIGLICIFVSLKDTASSKTSLQSPCQHADCLRAHVTASGFGHIVWGFRLLAAARGAASGAGKGGTSFRTMPGVALGDGRNFRQASGAPFQSS
jgi:hypothetical protein